MNRPKDPPNSQKKQDPKHINASVTVLMLLLLLLLYQ
jgi:hypothetical protein